MQVLKSRVIKAGSAFTRLRNIWNFQHQTRYEDDTLYKHLFIPVLMYRCEIWKVNKGDDRTINVLHKTTA